MLALVLTGCASARDLRPDRFGVGVVVDADTGELKTANASLFWSLRYRD